jgi:hypothetical protein
VAVVAIASAVEVAEVEKIGVRRNNRRRPSQ